MRAFAVGMVLGGLLAIALVGQDVSVVAQPTPSWKVLQIPSITSDVERTVNGLTTEGWTLVHVGIESGGVARVYLFFRRP